MILENSRDFSTKRYYPSDALDVRNFLQYSYLTYFHSKSFDINSIATVYLF